MNSLLVITPKKWLITENFVAFMTIGEGKDELGQMTMQVSTGEIVETY